MTDIPQVHFPDFMAITIGLVTYLLGESINKRVALLRQFNIPDAVTGGLLVALLFYGLHAAGVVTVSFDTHTRDMLLLIFFTGIGLNARISDLLKGGKPLAVLIGLTAILLVLQNVIGALGAWVSGLPIGMGVALGSTSLLGGHGTMIAWAPEFEARGLVVGSVIGGPLGRSMIEGHGLRSLEPDAVNSVGLSETAPPPQEITRNALMRTLLTVFICIILGFSLQQAVLELGLMLPLFVPCLLVGILVGNVLPYIRFIRPVSHTPALSLLSEFSLGVFLSVSLMALQLWALAGMAWTLIAVLAAQTLLALGFARFAAFRLLGQDYPAAVMSAGYASFVVGATPTAVATMTAVTKRYGPAQTAFIVLPLVSALFVDIANALVTQGFLNLFAR